MSNNLSIQKFYKGFFTRNYENFGNGFDIFNVACIEEDLINEIFTLRGDRVGMPTYGTRIPIMTFEINDEEAHAVVLEDLNTVFAHDPRVQVLAVDIIPATDKNALIAVAKLLYLEFQVTKDLYIEIISQ